MFPQTLTLRPFQWEDLDQIVAIFNRITPHEPTSLEEVAHWERTYPKSNPRLRYMVAWEDGPVVATGACLQPFWMSTPGAYWVDIAVDPGYQHRGIGRALLALLEPYGWAQGAERLWGNCREDFADSIRFLERAGYDQIGVRFESALDLATFDEGPFVWALDRAKEQGYTLTTLAVENLHEPNAGRLLFELYVKTMADVPFPGGAHPQASYENWRNWMLEGPSADPAGIFIAKQGAAYVAMTQLELPRQGPAATGSTGVLREHRSRGLATALKLLSFRFLRERGYVEVRAHNDTANPPILRLNQKLGYRRLPGWLSWEKMRFT